MVCYLVGVALLHSLITLKEIPLGTLTPSRDTQDGEFKVERQTTPITMEQAKKIIMQCQNNVGIAWLNKCSYGLAELFKNPTTLPNSKLVLLKSQRNQNRVEKEFNIEQ